MKVLACQACSQVGSPDPEPHAPGSWCRARGWPEPDPRGYRSSRHVERGTTNWRGNGTRAPARCNHVPQATQLIRQLSCRFVTVQPSSTAAVAQPPPVLGAGRSLAIDALIHANSLVLKTSSMAMTRGTPSWSGSGPKGRLNHVRHVTLTGNGRSTASRVECSLRTPRS